MSKLTVSALMALISANHCVPPAVAPIMVGIARHESGLDPTAVHHNANGTIDVGIAQVNSTNFGWLGLTMATAFDPCRNIAAGARVLFAKYNGNPPDVVKAAYAADVIAKIPAGAQPPLDKRQVDPDDPQPAAWDMEAVADWRRRHAPTPEDAAEAPAVPPPAIAELIPKKESK
jgi:type IV secretion system protein VirB1